VRGGEAAIPFFACLRAANSEPASFPFHSDVSLLALAEQASFFLMLCVVYRERFCKFAVAYMGGWLVLYSRWKDIRKKSRLSCWAIVLLDSGNDGMLLVSLLRSFLPNDCATSIVAFEGNRGGFVEFAAIR
jgi:hypothetical protein